MRFALIFGLVFSVCHAKAQTVADYVREDLRSSSLVFSHPTCKVYLYVQQSALDYDPAAGNKEIEAGRVLRRELEAIGYVPDNLSWMTPNQLHKFLKPNDIVIKAFSSHRTSDNNICEGSAHLFQFVRSEEDQRNVLRGIFNQFDGKYVTSVGPDQYSYGDGVSETGVVIRSSCFKALRESLRGLRPCQKTN